MRAGDSLRGRMRGAQMVLVVLMLIPALVAISLMGAFSQDYHKVIEHIADISMLRPIIQEELPDEVMDIVYGRKSFEEGRQYDILKSARDALDRLIEIGSASRLELEVSRRLLDGLTDYVDRIAQSATVDEQIAAKDEIVDMAGLFWNMLQDAVNVEINAAAEDSERKQIMVRTALIIEAGILLVSLLFAALTQSSLSKAVRAPLGELEEFAGRIAGGELSVRAKDTDVLELCGLNHSLNAMAVKLERLIEENRLEQENLKKSELRALQAQITPHFLYNTLDAIVWLAEAGSNQEVIEVTSALSSFFRISLNNGRDWVTIAEEWKHVEGYLTIQKIRYRDILQYELAIDEELRSHKMLKLLIQPLVENAIYHGIKNRRGGGVVRVTAKQAGDHLRVKVQDTGMGMDEERLRAVRKALAASDSAETGYGLFSVNRRIRLYYNQPEGLTVTSGPEGTSVGFEVPIRE